MKISVSVTGLAGLLLGVLCFICLQPRLSAQQYDTKAVVDSVRKDGIVTMLFDSRPSDALYYMLHEGRVIGTVSISDVRRHADGSGARYRVTALYAIQNRDDYLFLRAGLEIGLRAMKKQELSAEAANVPVERIDYRKTITTPVDGREMVLVSEGKFVFGASDGNRDEYPETMIFLPAFYIDRTEVTNSEYRRFVVESNSPAPRTWKDNYPENTGEFPVIVTYYEAERYARWAGKRLPTEEEWEKAARGPGFRTVIEGGVSYIIKEPIRYPWGNTFSHERLNAAEYWDRLTAVSKGDVRPVRGLMPVISFAKNGASPFGALNMAGNAMEWTSSWYAAYQGSTYRDRRFGKQYKVLRGGAWYSQREDVRASHRQIGGAPNLYMDAIGGFRCVREPSVTDRVP